MGTITSIGDRTPSTASPVFLWCHETRQQPFETGIQRVVRRLSRGLAESGIEVVPVAWDCRRRLIIALGPLAAHFDRALEAVVSKTGNAPWLFVPELSLGLAAADLDPVHLGIAYGLKTAALLHDVIPLKLAADYDDGFLTLFRRYIDMFAVADLVLTTTNYVADDLRAHLNGAGSRTPDIATVPLPAQFANFERCLSIKEPRAPGVPLRLLTVSTWEPRKNLPRLLRAIRRAESQSASTIELAVVGRRGCFAAYDAEVETLIAEMPRVTVHGTISDEDLVALYARCHASVYPSVEEGFGLPIGESLWLATPCVCHNGSSMKEVAPGGGTLMIDMTNEAAIAGALLDLLNAPGLSTRISAEAANRSLTSWRDYACKVASKLMTADVH